MRGVAERTGAIRVMHILYSLRMGGTENGVVRISNGLQEMGIASSICSCKPADGLRERLRPDVPLFEFNRKDGNDPLFVLRLARLLRRERPDLVHTHSWGTLIEGLVAAKLAGIGHVVHGEHGTMELRPRNLRIQRRAWAQADALLSVSSRLAERMAESVGYPVEHIDVIHNGIDTERFTPARRAAGRTALGLSNELLIGTAGRLVPVKDQAGFLRALAHLRSRGLDFTAVIAGDGPLRGELEALAGSLGIANRVRFLGERSDIDAVLAAFDIFVLSSVSEGMSNTILEAMASGVPVVATHVGGADELVVDGLTGTLVPASNPEALGNALVELGMEPARGRRFGAAGRKRVERFFSQRSMLEGYRNVYARLVTPRVLDGAACVA